MKVLVTGAAGMLGRGLMGALRSNSSIEARGLSRSDLDLRDPVRLRVELHDFRPDVVIHAAAKVGGIQSNVEQPVEYLSENLLLDSNVITEALALGIQNFIYMGSSCIYPKDYRQPLVESDLLMGPLEPTNEGYALAKIAGAKLCEYATRTLGVNYKTLIPSNLYGPGDNFRVESSHLLASVIRKVHETKESGSREITVWGSGEARREFTYIEDLTDWIVGYLDHIEDLPDRLNLGMGIDYSVNEFYGLALDVLGVKANLVHDRSKPEGMRAKLMDSSVASMRHGWRPTTDLQLGIRKTYDWFLSQQKMEL